MSGFRLTIALNPYIDGEETSFDFAGTTSGGMKWKARARQVAWSGTSDNSVWVTGPGYKKGTKTFAAIDRQEILYLNQLPPWVVKRLRTELDRVQESLNTVKKRVDKVIADQS